MDILKEKWMEDEGCIYTINKENIGTIDCPIMVTKAIAYNVGNEVAKHIVELHNGSLVYIKFLQVNIKFYLNFRFVINEIAVT